MRERGARMLMLAVAWTLTLAASGAVLLGSAEPAAACSCAGFTDEAAIEEADAVFTGTLVEIVTPEGEMYSSVDPERFVFEVDEVFKGKVVARQAIVTAREGMSCGLEISGAGPFVVFAHLESDGITTGAVEGEFYSDLCSGTRALSSGAVPAIFGDASPPISGASPIGGVEAEDVGDDGDERPIGQIAAIAGAVALGAAHSVRRRRQRAG